MSHSVLENIKSLSLDGYLRFLNRIDANLLWKRYLWLCKESGLEQAYFILSFDCDTDEDIQVVWDVHERLMDMGIKSVYAVPGEQLQKGVAVYGKIQETGSCFLNHGGCEHTYYDKVKERYVSSFFYHEESLQALEEDIYKGHERIERSLGIKPQGFRTPHFGTFQKREHLQFLYKILRKLNYQYSSSTVPFIGFKKGPFYDQDGMIEFPVTGVPLNPFHILDSWGFFACPDRVYGPENYLQECQKMSSISNGVPFLVNIYADPSHVYNQEIFFQSMKKLLKFMKNTDYQQLIENCIGKRV